MPRRIRRKYFVDKKLQGSLLKQVAKYWLYSAGAIGVLTTCGWLLFSPGIVEITDSLRDMAAIGRIFYLSIVASFLVLPFVLLEVIRFSNRFAGPMLRLRRCMQELADGKRVEPIEFRQGDFWQEFADAFNGILVRLDAEQSRSTDGLTTSKLPDSASHPKSSSRTEATVSA